MFDSNGIFMLPQLLWYANALTERLKIILSYLINHLFHFSNWVDAFQYAIAPT